MQNVKKMNNDTENLEDDFIPNNAIVDIQGLVKIVVPVIILFIGIFGLFSKTISEEQAEKLIFAGSLSTGLGIKNKE